MTGLLRHVVRDRLLDIATVPVVGPWCEFDHPSEIEVGLDVLRVLDAEATDTAVVTRPPCGGSCPGTHRTEAFVSHSNARLTVFFGRRLLVDRVRSGRPVAHVAAEMGISRATAHKWMQRWRAEGEAGLHDRSSRPRTTPHRTLADIEARVCGLRQSCKLGPARIGPILGLSASTVHRILARHGIHRLAWPDRPTARPPDRPTARPAP